MRRRAWLAAAVLLLAAAAGAGPLPPQVTKVEPPSWWPGHSIDPVRLLVRGRHLHGARVAGTAPGLRAEVVKVNPNGTYAFIDVSIDRQAAPGPRRLALATPHGRAEAAFEVLPPLPRAGRFQGFSGDDVFYLAMPDRFANGDPRNDQPAGSAPPPDRGRPRRYHGGDLRGLIQKLPYLRELGVTVLWLNPFYDNSNRPNTQQTDGGDPTGDYHGYHAVDYYAVEDRFGDLATLRELSEAARAHGIKLVQDQVANHVGPHHPWVEDPPTPTWLNGTRDRHLVNRWQTWTLMDPHATPEAQRETLEGWFVDLLPDLNQDDPEAARYLIQNSLWWVGVAGLDGIRQDTLPYVPRRFWRDWTAALAREHPHLSVVGELFDGNPALVAFYQGGAARFDGIDTGIHSLFDFPLYYAIRRVFIEGQPPRELAVALSHDHLYPRPEALVTFLGLHDVKRFMGEPKATREGLMQAFTFLFTTRGVPLVYYGDEIAMAGGDDPDNRRDFPGGWPGDARDAFGAGRTAEEQAVFDHVRRLARLRREQAPLRRGSLVTLAADEQAYAFARVHEGRSVVVAFNRGDGPAALDLDAAAAGLEEGARLRDALGSPGEPRVAGGRLALRVPPRTAAVYLLGP